MMSSLSAALFKDETEIVDEILHALPWTDEQAKTTQNRSVDLIRSIRTAPRKPASLESFFQHYALNTQEGLALMCLAEAMLRIPDAPTADDLIRDKIAGTVWLDKLKDKDSDLLTRAAGFGLNLSAGAMNSILSKLGQPVIRTAIGQAMKLLGGQFVLGQSIDEAVTSAQKYEKKGYRLSYDMLGEGARTAEDAAAYFENYKQGIQTAAGSEAPIRPGLSVKLSALHPRYALPQSERCVPVITDRLAELCAIAMENGLPLTVDAEECERLEISLEVIEKICSSDLFKGWNGFGLAVQTYQKRALPLIDHMTGLARQNDRVFQIRLVKGAYWDSEIKRAQELGLPNYPVFTRKNNTDLSFLACAHHMLQQQGRLFPMFGTHNAHSVAAILTMAGQNREFEFQKLFGMGDALYDHLVTEQDAKVSIYAPVGKYNELLPYLVRRLLENGANSSFINQVYDGKIPPEDLARDPVKWAQSQNTKYHPDIPLPEDLYGPERKNAAGIDLTDRQTIENLQHGLSSQSFPVNAAAIIGGKAHKKGGAVDVFNPAHTSEKIGTCYLSSMQDVDGAFATARRGYQVWSQTPSTRRAEILFRIANLYEERRDELISLCVKEGGKTLPDALAEVREAVDFCRYYAAHGQKIFDEIGFKLPGPTGEDNIYKLESRGIFICISPWNFPLAIFTGQIVAALMAGNAVIAKPAEDTPMIGVRAIQIMHEAGIPAETLNILIGDGKIGAALIDHLDVAGAAFTGSTEVARKINLSLAEKEGPIVPFIAETGGQNAMIVDSSAMTEQVIDDVILSAFGSTGQRCSACRILYVQDEVADKTITMLAGAMSELQIGDPEEIETDIGPVINLQQKTMLQRHKTKLEGFGRKIAETPLPEHLDRLGHYFAPIAYEIPSIDFLEQEIFGPVLHVIRYRKHELDHIIRQINETGYGLTFGVHSRINSFSQKLAGQVKAGNIYVNRGTIGAVVGSQPFGGRGLSGTGPKAGGPGYLLRFATEKVISTDTTAAGGNASLVMLSE